MRYLWFKFKFIKIICKYLISYIWIGLTRNIFKKILQNKSAFLKILKTHFIIRLIFYVEYLKCNYWNKHAIPNSPPLMNGLESVCMISTYKASVGSNLTIGSVWLKWGSAGSRPVIRPIVTPKFVRITLPT